MQKKMTESPQTLLESAIIQLIFDNPFFAHMLQSMKREFTTKVPTLGVSVTDTLNLYVNPYFFASLTTIERAEILKHEVMHVVNAHMVRFRELEPSTFDKKDRSLIEKVEDMMKASASNKAADYAINEVLPNLPKILHLFDEEGNVIVEPDEYVDQNGNVVKNPTAGKPLEGRPCLVDDLKKVMPNVKNNQNMEYYYNLIREKQKQQQQGQSGNGSGGEGDGQGDGEGGKDGKKKGKNRAETTIDDHSTWNECGEQDGEYTLEKIKQTVAKAVEATGGREAGKIPSDVLEAIERLNYKARDWKSDLQKFVARTSEILIDSSRKVRNRRYGIIYPGCKVFPKMHLAAVVDTSGSMSNDALGQIAAELYRISENGVEITVIEADCTVQNVWKFDKKKLAEFKGRGGTAYQPAFDKCAELDVDGAIYFGDMDSSDQPKKPRFPVLWAVTESYNGHFQKPPATFGMITHVKINKKK